MNRLYSLLACFLFAGCASDPLMTGKPQDWQGKQAADLRTAWGEPTKITTKSDGGEIWEYLESGDFKAPESENTSFRLGGFGGNSAFGAGGGISTVKQPEHTGRYQRVFRFSIKNGKIKSWYAARVEDGRIVWEDH